MIFTINESKVISGFLVFILLKNTECSDRYLAVFIGEKTMDYLPLQILRIDL